MNAPPRGWHDPAACLVIDGVVVALGEEERFTRSKHAPHQPPRMAVERCLLAAGCTIEDVHVVAVGWDVPALHAERHGAGTPFPERAYLEYLLGPALPARLPELVFVPHHLAHATCGYFASPFTDAAVLVIDGIGEAESTSVYSAHDGRLTHRRSWAPRHSLGLMYDAACKYVGLSSLEAGKLMGLASYGRVGAHAPWPLAMLADRDDYRLHPAPSTSMSIEEIIGGWLGTFATLGPSPSARTTRDTLHRDAAAVRVAWSAQACVERTVEHLGELARRMTGHDALCLVGGVALNCSANGRLRDPLFVPPVPHDAGVALGAAWHVSPPSGARGALSPYLGPTQARADAAPARVSGAAWHPVDEARVIDRLQQGGVGAIVDGRAEVGPRALCHRSIVTLPRPVAQRERVNRIKHRERWRPFGPVALASDARALWEPSAHLHRYMLGAAAPTCEAVALLPAAVHVDGTTRPQILDDADAGVVARLLRAMCTAGMPAVLLNTSFNGAGEPVVDSASDAITAFQQMDLDFLLIEDRMLVRASRA